MKTQGLALKNISASVAGKRILNGISLEIARGTTHVIMGPNGGGKSTLSQVILGHPGYEVTVGRGGYVRLDGRDIRGLSTDARARRGIFLAFQSPIAVPGVSAVNLLRTAFTQRSADGKSGNGRTAVHNPALRRHAGGGTQLVDFMNTLKAHARTLAVDESFLRRGINDGFSGGEKKKMEMLQALALKPAYAIFDEIDTGLDVDSLKTVATGIRLLKKQGAGILIITHYQRILRYVAPDVVHILVGGKIVKTGGPALAAKIEKDGYRSFGGTA